MITHDREFTERIRIALQAPDGPEKRRCVLCGREFNLVMHADHFCSDHCRKRRYTGGLDWRLLQ